MHLNSLVFSSTIIFPEITSGMFNWIICLGHVYVQAAENDWRKINKKHANWPHLKCVITNLKWVFLTSRQFYSIPQGNSPSYSEMTISHLLFTLFLVYLLLTSLRTVSDLKRTYSQQAELPPYLFLHLYILPFILCNEWIDSTRTWSLLNSS